jgi:cystathionine beta-lyase/cystathionine gamma-synthase
MLGAICGRAADWDRVPAMVSIWGLASSPFDCWLATRGLATLHLRAKAASANALAVAEFLTQQKNAASNVRYPGLASHADHAVARKQFGEHCGAMVTFDLVGGLAAAEKFITAVAEDIPFCPSLGEVSTTLSHPASTSHRALAPEDQTRLGITGGTIRLSIGTESPEHIIASLNRGL